ncbi:MAG: hypothetical protein U0271_13790 [Polyangiaceae bacterium]
MRSIPLLVLLQAAALVGCGDDGSGGAGATGGAGAAGGAGASAAGGAGGTGGTPLPQKGLGEPCTDELECEAGYCVDGVCCGGTCTGLCVSCGIAGFEGQCSPIPIGEDPDDECGDGVCDGLLQCASGAHVFSHAFGSAEIDLAHTVSTDSAGSIYILATIHGPVDFGGGSLNVVGQEALAIAKLSPTGAHLWSRVVPGTFGSATLSADDAGVTLATELTGAADFGLGPITPSSGVGSAVARFDPAGAAMWSRALDARALAATRDTAGNIVVVGAVPDGGVLGGAPITTSGLEDAFILELASATGDPVDEDVRGGDADDAYTHVTAEASGGLFLGGTFTSSTIAFEKTLTLKGTRDAFFVQVSAAGVPMSSFQYGASGKDSAIGGITLTQTGPVLASTLDTATTVRQLTFELASVWQKTFPVPLTGLVADLGSSLVITGAFSGTITLGGKQFSTATPGDTDGFVAKLTPLGELVWFHPLAGAGVASGPSLAVPLTRHALVLSTFDGDVTLGGESLVSAGASDVVVGKLEP